MTKVSILDKILGNKEPEKKKSDINKPKEEVESEDKISEKVKTEMLKEFDKKMDSLFQEHKVWAEQYQRTLKNMSDGYDKRSKEFENKANIIRENLEKNIDARKDVIDSLGKVLEFDKVIKYQTSGLIRIDDLGDLRELGEGNWEVIVLAKKIK